MSNKPLKNFDEYLKIYESDDTRDQIDTIKDVFQIYQTNKSKVDSLYNKYKNSEENGISEMDQEFEKIVSNLDNDDLLKKYYLSKKLEVKKIKLESEVKDILEELKKNQAELAEMTRNLS